MSLGSKVIGKIVYQFNMSKIQSSKNKIDGLKNRAISYANMNYCVSKSEGKSKDALVNVIEELKKLSQEVANMLEDTANDLEYVKNEMQRVDNDIASKIEKKFNS